MASVSGDKRSPTPGVPRRIVVTHCLPLRAETNPGARHGFDFSLDRDALPHQLSRGLPGSVVFVGALPSAAASIPASEELADELLESFSCSPVFLDADLHENFYGEFCKHYLWPMLHYHYLIPVAGSSFYPLGDSVRGFDEKLYRNYLTANTQFAERVAELLNPVEDLVFIHDYHLMALPSILRRKSPRARLSFFLHSPFPASEIFRMMPCREDLLRALLNADLVGFQTYDYARHFLSACSRLLGFSSHSNHGNICIDYYGRTVVVKILSVGVDMSQLRDVLLLPETAAKAREIATMYEGRKLFLGVDDIDLFDGIHLKLSAMEKLLMSHTELRGKVVLVQIINPARSPGSDIDVIRVEVLAMRDRINTYFGWPGYDPIVVIDDPLPMHEKLGFYTAADICVVTALRAGLNRTPYIYTVCRQEGPIAGWSKGALRESATIVSEFAGCSPSLSGAFRINPWNENEVVDAMHEALMLGEQDRQMRHAKHYRYVITHGIANWATSLDQDLQKACKDHESMNILSVGLAMKFRVAVLGPNFQKLLPGHINPAYHRTSDRLILLDYDGTVQPYEMDKAPSQDLIAVLNKLCSDPKNAVFIVSGRGKDQLAGWFAPCERLGIAAEHGYFTRWNKNSQWESANLAMDSDWKSTARPMMQLYTDTTEGSYIEAKDTALVWHYEEADVNFGLCQSKELKDHLQSMLSDYPVYVKSGHQIVEVIPQGVSKGITVENLLSTMRTRGSVPDFILCVGDDRSDEDMFKVITSPKSNSAVPDTAEIFACTIGYKPTSAKYFLEEPSDVLKMLQGLTILPTSDLVASQGQVFEDPQE